MIILPYNRPRDYSKAGQTLYTAHGAGQKRTNLVIIGASVAWGDGLDMTQQYSTLIQKSIDNYLGVQLNAPAARMIHTDDLMEGDTTANATDPGTRPYNGGRTVSGWGAGINSPSSYLYNASNYSNGVYNYGRSKFNYLPYDITGAPTKADSGIFGGSTYGGGKNTSFTNGQIRLQSSGQNIRMGCGYQSNLMPNTGGYLILGASGNGSAIIYGATVNSDSTIFTWKDNGGNYSGNSFYTINVSSATPTRFNLVLDTTPPPGWNSANIVHQGIAIYWVSGTVDIQSWWIPKTAAAANHIVVQVCARNSYCLTDYNQPTVLDAIMKSVNWNPATDVTTSPPFYVLGDTYNSMVTPNGGDATTTRSYNPSDYAQQLEQMGKYLSDSANYNPGKIILTMPIREQTGFRLPNATSWGSAGYSDSAYNGAALNNYQWSDYWQAIYRVAAFYGWGFLDQMDLPSINTSSPYGSNLSADINGNYVDPMPTTFYQADGIHPTATGAALIAARYVRDLGLSGGV